MRVFDFFKRGSRKPITKNSEYNEIPTNFLGFFVMLKRKFWNISNVNLLYVLCNFPVFFLLFTFTGRTMEDVLVVSSPMFSSLFGFISSGMDKALAATVFPFVNTFVHSSVPTAATYILYSLSALVIFTFGLSNVGAAYCIRGYNRGDPIFLMSDFFGCIKRNFKQGLVMGVLDFLICFVLIWDFTFWNGQAHLGFINGVFMYFSLFLCVLYFFMRFYVYTLIITFDLPLFKVLKNSFLMSFLGFKRNFIALLGIILLCSLNFQLFLLLPSLGIMLPIIITIALGMFIAGYASYPVIKKYMIDPFYPEENNNYNDDGEEPVFEDRG